MLTSARIGGARATGFSLIELMIAMVAGLIVIGALIAFTVTTVRAYSENIRSTRLSQELRTSMNIVVRELRRSGYDALAVSRVLAEDAPAPSGFDNMSANTDCVVYEYDRGVTGSEGPAATERRGIRFNSVTQTMQMNASSSSVDCAGTEGWEDLTDSRVVEITGFSPVLTERAFCSVVASRDTADLDTTPDQFDLAEGGVRTISLCLKGRLAAEAGIERQVVGSVRVRTDGLQFRLNQDLAARDACKALPAAPALQTPDLLNSACAELGL